MKSIISTVEAENIQIRNHNHIVRDYLIRSKNW